MSTWGAPVQERRSPGSRAVRQAHGAADPVAGSNMVCVRDHNQLLVLHMVRTRGASTRRDLSRLTGLTFQTIENIARRLIEAGMLEDLTPATVHDRARRLALRPAGAHAVGIELAPDGFRIVACDLAGGAVAEQRRFADSARHGDMSDELASAMHNVIDEAEVPLDTVVAIGLTVSGSLLEAPDDAARSREIVRDGLQRRFRLPVVASSSVVAAARGEQWRGRASARELVYVHLAGEIGCAVISRGQLLVGARGRGGEITHTPTSSVGGICSCGRRGCLGTFLSEQGLRRVIAAAVGAAEPPTLEEIARTAASSRAVADALDCLATHLADAVLPAVQLLDPEILMIGGPVADALGAVFCGVLERRVAAAFGQRPVPIVECASPGTGGATSAARDALHVTLTPAISHLILDTVAVSGGRGRMSSAEPSSLPDC